MTNLEGRVLRRRRALDAAGRRAAATSRSWPTSPRRLGRRTARSPTDPRVVFDELRAGRPGGRADYSGITLRRGSTRARSLHWPCPHRVEPTRARRGCSSTVRHPDGRARFVAGRARGPAEDLRRRLPARTLTTGRVLQHYQSGAQTRRVAGSRPQPARRRSSSCTRTAAAARASSDGDVVASSPGRGDRASPAAVDADDPAGHRVHAVPLGRRRHGPTRSPTTRSTRSPDARVQGLRRRAWTGDRVTGCDGRRPARRSSSSATAWPAPGSSRSSAAATPTRPVRRHRRRRGAARAPTTGSCSRPSWLASITARDTRLSPTAGGRAPDRRPSRGEPASRRSTATTASCDHRRRRRHSATTELVLATGAAPFVAADAGASGRTTQLAARRASRFRTLDDCARILAAAAVNAATRVVLGGGLLGLEAARGLAGRGVASPSCTPSAPDGAPARRRRRCGARPGRCDGLGPGSHYAGSASPRHAAPRRRSRRTSCSPTARRLPADLLVVAAGSGPAPPRRRRRACTSTRGIVVDDRLGDLDDPHVHAIGDCAAAPTARWPGWSRRAGSRPRVLADVPHRSGPGRRRTDGPQRA